VIRRIDPEVVASLRPTIAPSATPGPPSAALSRQPTTVPPPLPRAVTAYATTKPPPPVVAKEEGDLPPQSSGPHVRMYRGRIVTDD
jgi:hypothetical protein